MLKKYLGIFVVYALLLATIYNQASALSYSELLSGIKQKVLGESTVATSFESGSLVDENGTIYLISGSVKIPFTNFEAFKGLGYSLKNVVKGNLSNYTLATSYFISTAEQEHPWGSWLLYKGVVYLSTQTGLVAVPSWDVFLANGGKSSLILNANKYDIAQIKPEAEVGLIVVKDSRVINAGVAPVSLTTPITENLSTTKITCSYPAPPIGFHYEGQDYDNLCGKYLVLDAVSECAKDTSCVNPANGNLDTAPIIVASGVPTTILVMSPLKGAVGQEVVLTGLNFTATGNTINFGSGAIPDIASESQGTKLRFLVPEYLTAACYFSKPSCLMASMLVKPGTYPVSVQNSNGISNSINYEITSEGWCPGPILCAPPPVGYSYSGGGKCSCGTLVKTESLKTCSVQISCPAPPLGYYYSGGDTCTCGQLVEGSPDKPN